MKAAAHDAVGEKRAAEMLAIEIAQRGRIFQPDHARGDFNEGVAFQLRQGP